MDRFRIFRLRDALTVGGVCLFFTITLIMGHLRPENEGNPALKAHLAVTLVGWAIYGFLLWQRWRWVKSIAFVTKHGIGVIKKSYRVDQAEFEAEVDAVIGKFLKLDASWERRAREALDGLLVIWKPFPFEAPPGSKRPGFFAGMYYPATKVAMVGHRLPLSSTALGHEVGHVIFGCTTGEWSEEDFHHFEVEKL